MIVLRKSLARRTLLRGIGASLSLPFLDAMVPAFAGPQSAAAKPTVRLGFVYVPNGIIMNKWTPSATGSAFQLTPTLEPLAPFRERLLVLSGLGLPSAKALPGENGGEHPRACSTFLTGAHPEKNLHAGISADQIAAREFGKYTQLGSLELSLGSGESVGLCDGDWNCLYQCTISWRTPTTPMPMENQPRAVFERLFGDSDSTDPAARLARIRKNRRLLDSVREDIAGLTTSLGPADRSRLDEYLDAVHDVERRVQMAEQQSSREVPTVERPAGIPGNYEEYARLMIDLQVLAFQTDLTRVGTLMMDHEGTAAGRNYPELNIADLHHTLSHHNGDAGKIAKLETINQYHAKMFSYYLEKLRSVPDGEGTLLDHSLILYGSGMSDGNIHLSLDLPVLLAGGAGGRIRGGQHLQYPLERSVPMANLYLTMLDAAGVPVQQFGDSTGQLDLLSV